MSYIDDADYGVYTGEFGDTRTLQIHRSVRVAPGYATKHRDAIAPPAPVQTAPVTYPQERKGAQTAPKCSGVPDYHAKKFDAGKSRMDLLPWAALEAVGSVLAYGCDKYAENSWQTVPDARKRYTAAMLRHLSAMQEGESHDKESGHLHAAHCATNALFVLWFTLKGK